MFSLSLSLALRASAALGWVGHPTCACCAQSRWNAKNRFTGWTDVTLTKQGERESWAAGRLLQVGLRRWITCRARGPPGRVAPLSLSSSRVVSACLTLGARAARRRRVHKPADARADHCAAHARRGGPGRRRIQREAVGEAVAGGGHARRKLAAEREALRRADGAEQERGDGQNGRRVDHGLSARRGRAAASRRAPPTVGRAA